MEIYNGIAATNLRNNLDVAFSQRLQMIDELSVPSIADRERIWRRMSIWLHSGEVVSESGRPGRVPHGTRSLP